MKKIIKATAITLFIIIAFCLLVSGIAWMWIYHKDILVYGSLSLFVAFIIGALFMMVYSSIK